MRHIKSFFHFALFIFAVLALPVVGQESVTSPEQQFGHEIGADYQLPNYTQLYEYWQKLASESDRMSVEDIGLTSQGRPQIMAVITAPQNRADLDRYRDIARRLAKAEAVSEEEARRLSQEGKAVIWIDGGLHATEVLGAQQLMEMVYRMVSRSDPETLRILDDVILLAVHANPDGMELVSDWYMRQNDPLKRSTSGVPELYNEYAGHDNNRDFYMSALSESTNMNRVMYREWYPQIVYNHHQTGPSGTVMFAPPFRDPPNHNLDPLIITGLDGVGAAMHGRFVREGKGGTTMRSRGQLLHLVERRPSNYSLLQEHDRSAHGDDRQSHSHRDSFQAGPTAATRRPSVAGRAGGLAFPAVDRVFADGELGGPGLRFEEPGPPAVRDLADGNELYRAGRPRHVDGRSLRGRGRGREPRWRAGGVRPRLPANAAPPRGT